MASYTINGWHIFDLRDQLPKSGWLVRCDKDYHETNEYFYRLSEAKIMAKTTICAECVEEEWGQK